MTPDDMFAYANRLAMLGWLPLLLVPLRHRWPQRWALAVALLLGLGYAAFIGAFMAQGKGSFATLSGVVSLFENRGVLLAGWVHYLAFDLLVGRWVRGEAVRLGMRHLGLVPILLLVFMFGPVGWVLFMGWRWLHQRPRDASVVPAAALAGPGWWAELQRREPLLARLAMLMLLGLVPCLLAMAVDTRQVNGISIWVKPTKFFVSMALFYATLAWFFDLVPAAARASRSARWVVGLAAACGLFEMAWLLLAAVAGVPSHFNRQQPAWAVAYAAAGVGALGLLTAIVLQARLIQREARPDAEPGYRQAVVIGAYAAAASTLAVVAVLSSGTGHWVGGTPSDAQGLPLLGWSRDGGDLRVAHFFALHLQQAVPLAAWLAWRFGARGRAVAATGLAAAVLGLAVVAFTFVQARSGAPFLG